MRKFIFFLLAILFLFPSLASAGNYAGNIIDMKSSAYSVSEILFTPSGSPVVFYSASDLSGYKVVNERFYFTKDGVTSKVYSGFKGFGGYFSQDGKKFVFGYSKDNKMYIYDNGKILGSYNPHTFGTTQDEYIKSQKLISYNSPKNEGHWISDPTCKQQEKAIKSASGLIFIKSCNTNKLSVYKNGVSISEIEGSYNQGTRGPWIGVSQNQDVYALSFAVKNKTYILFNGKIYKQDSSDWNNSKYAISNDGKNFAYTSYIDGKIALNINNNQADICDFISFTFSPDSKKVYYTCSNTKWEKQKLIYTRNELITINLRTMISQKITSEGFKKTTTIAKDTSTDTGTINVGTNQFDATKLTQSDINRITIEQNVGTEYRLFKSNNKSKAEFLQDIAENFGGINTYAYKYAQTLSFSK